MKTKAEKLPVSKVAEILPRMTPQEYITHKASILKSGGPRQRIVLMKDDENGIMVDYFGCKVSILDGRHRQDACAEQSIDLFYETDFRLFGSDDRDGDSPTRFAIDMNAERRSLTTSQKAAIATNALPFFTAEARARRDAALNQGGQKGTPAPEADKGRAVEKAAEATGVGTTIIQQAAEVKKEAPEEFKKIETGEQTVNKAVTKLKEKKTAEPPPPEQADERAKTIAESIASITETNGEEFAKAVSAGTILKDIACLQGFVTLGADDRRLIGDLIIRGWTVKKAIAFMHGDVKRTDEISTLFMRVNARKAAGQDACNAFEVDGWCITVERVKDGA